MKPNIIKNEIIGCIIGDIHRECTKLFVKHLYIMDSFHKKSSYKIK